MTIDYSNGKSVEAEILSRTEQTMRVAVQGAEDVWSLRISAALGDGSVRAGLDRFEWQRNGEKPA